MQPRPFPRTFVILILAIATINALAQHYYWFWRMRWFDVPMHFAGGVWLAGVAIWWRFFSGKFSDAPGSFADLAMWGVFAAFSVGFAWEIYEAVVSFVTKGYINAMSDTLSDLSFDILGGLAVAVAVWLKMKDNNLKT